MRRYKIRKIIAGIAYYFSFRSANSAGSFFFHQSELPDKVRKLRRF